MLEVTLALTVAGYLVSALLFYLALMRSPASASYLGWARRLLEVTSVVQATDIVVRSIVVHACPVQSAAFALSLAALVATAGFLVWAKRGRLLSLGLIVAPLSLGMFVASQVLLRQATAPAVPGWFLSLHVLANLAAVALFVLAAAAAIAYLFQAGRLKSKRPAAAKSAFPGLSSLESLIQRLLAFGLGPMTLGVISGAVFAERLSRGGMELVRITLAYACWLVVASLVAGHRLIGWNGRKMAWGAVTAAAIAVAVVVLYALAAEGHA
jgi:ABC-type uncharacterized transport system permease subunit